MRLIRLILIALFISFTILLSAQLKEFEIREIPAPTGIALIMDNPDCAQLVIHSQIVGLRFESNMAGISEQRHLSREDKYLVFITPVRQIITVKANGFIENQLGSTFELNAKERKYFVIDEKKQASGPGKGSFVLDSIPSGALIQIDGIPGFRERTPYHFKDYIAMNYSLTLSLDGYDDIDYNLQIKPDQEGSETLNLRANFAELVITSSPKARIYINGIDKGETPHSFEGGQSGLKAGKYTITLKRDRYNDIEETLNLNIGDKKIKRYQLEPLFAEAIINSNPSGSSVYFNEILLGKTPLELLGEDKALDSGEYNLQIVPSNSAFTVIEQKVIMKSGDLFSQTFNHSDLSRWLSLIVEEKPIEVYINEERNRELEQGEKILLTDEINTLKVVFSGKNKEQYQPYLKELRLLKGESHKEEVVFNTFKAQLDLRSDLNGVRLLIREKDSSKCVFKGKSNESIDLFPGSYTVSARKRHFHNLKTEIEVDNESTQLFEFNPQFKSNKPKTVLLELIASGGTFAAIGGAALASWQMSEKSYSDYQEANSVSDVERLRNNTQKWDKATQYLSAAEIAATAWLTRTVINFIKIKNLEKEVKRIQRFDSRS